MPSYKPAIASMSLGRAWVHPLPPKLSHAQVNGFTGIEIFYEDLEYHARTLSSLPQGSTPTDESLLEAATDIRALCTKHNLTVIGLQPFLFYEGLKDRAEHEKLIKKLHLWFQIAKLLETDIIQIPANFLPADKITGDLDVVVGDLQKVADLGAQETPVIRFAYENLCWSTYFPTWDSGWDLVKRVDRKNFGVCLDTFNIAGKVYGDPSAADGKTENAEEALRQSLDKLVKEVDVSKVFYVQVVDAEKMREKLVEGHPWWDYNSPSRMMWSRNARLFAGEEGGYLPVEEVLKAIIEDLGYKGWVSMELFSRTMAEEGEEVPKEHARRGAQAWKVVLGWFEKWGKEAKQF